MPTTNLEKVRERAVEVGVYLPLGAYARIRDGLADTGRPELRRLYEGLIERGQDRLEPIEQVVRRNAKRVARRADDAENKVERTAKRVARDPKKAARTVQAEVATPKMPRVATPKTASQLPIKGYKSLTAQEITSQLRGLTQTELAKVWKFEKANENRQTILESVEQKLTNLPIANYDSLTVDEITARLDGLSEGELKAIRRYESDTKARATILDKIETLLS
jgi:uncharacterized protein (DUF433 family)